MLKWLATLSNFRVEALHNKRQENSLKKNKNCKIGPWTVTFLLNYRCLFPNSEMGKTYIQVYLQILSRLKTPPRFTGSFTSFSSCTGFRTPKTTEHKKKPGKKLFFFFNCKR